MRTRTINGTLYRLLFVPKGTAGKDMPPCGSACMDENEAMIRSDGVAAYKFSDNRPWITHCSLNTPKDYTNRDWYIWVEHDYVWPLEGPIHNEYGEVAP